MQHIQIETPKKETKVNLEQLMETSFDMQKVFAYREPNVKSWEKDINHYCVFSNDGKKIKFLRSLKTYDANLVRELNIGNVIECLFSLGENLPNVHDNTDVMESKATHCLFDICNCDALLINARPTDKVQRPPHGLKNRKKVSYRELLQHELTFSTLQHENINKKNHQKDVFEF